MKSKSSARPVEFTIHSSPEEHALDPGKVHLWLLDLDELDLVELRRCPLSQEEVRRAGRLKDPISRRRSMASFALVRRILANVTRDAPEDLVFVRGVCGKPRVAPMGVHSALRDRVNFNLSHSENVFAVAVAHSLDVGVDVEVADIGKGIRSFYRAWTLQEAAAKLAGVGIASRNEFSDPRPFRTKLLELSFAGKDIILALAVAEPSVRTGPYQGVFFPTVLPSQSIDDGKDRWRHPLT